MSEINCEKCQNIPEQFVCLDCNHTFCLNCLAKQFKQQENQIQCDKCYEITILDIETIDALLQMKIKLLQPPTIIPYTTNKKNIQQESIIIKGHPFLEKLNISIEKLLDYIRSIQFDKQQLREISNKIKQDLDQEFKSLHLYLDQRQELFINDINKYETNIYNNLQLQEDNYQLDIEEMQIMKEEVKNILNIQQNGIQNDIESFKDILNQIDKYVIKSQQSYQSNIKDINDELYQFPQNWNEFSRQYKQFFQNLDRKILQNDNKQLQNSQFITVNRLEKIQQSLAIQLSSTNVKPIKVNHKSHISLCSPPRNSFLQDEFQIPRKSSRIEIISKINSPGDNRIQQLNRRNNRTIVPTLNLTGITFIK